MSFFLTIEKNANLVLKKNVKTSGGKKANPIPIRNVGISLVESVNKFGFKTSPGWPGNMEAALSIKINNNSNSNHSNNNSHGS